jgi:pre-mRNA-processing factor 40
VGSHTGPLPFSNQSGILPARPNLPDDPVIPHNGFLTVEESEKAFMHLLRKAGVDANWTWDQTMRAIITDPLYKALNTLAEKKAAWQKVVFLWLMHFLADSCLHFQHFYSIQIT